MPERKFWPLGDTAVVVDFGNVIDEKLNDKVIALFDYLNENPFDGFIEAVPAYSSLTVFYNTFRIQKKTSKNETALSWVEKTLTEIISTMGNPEPKNARSVAIPVCYDDEFAPDLRWISDIKGIAVEDVIQSHISKPYRVFMLGFLPGFAYMGEVNDNIAVPRKSSPRARIESGSIGLAGKQTGIYPLASPGGWQIIGRTPLRMFHPGKEVQSLLKTGDQVTFYPVSKEAFFTILNEQV